MLWGLVRRVRRLFLGGAERRWMVGGGWNGDGMPVCARNTSCNDYRDMNLGRWFRDIALEIRLLFLWRKLSHFGEADCMFCR